MPMYTVTDKAGAWVAGRVSPGAGEDMILAEREAAYELALGTIVPKETTTAKAPKKKA